MADTTTPATGQAPGNASPNVSGAGRARAWQDSAANNQGKKQNVPEGLWMRCPSCDAMLYRKAVEQNHHVCPECDHHYRIDAEQRIKLLVDPDSFEELWADLGPKDTLKFVDRIPYKDRITKEQKKTGNKDALLCGRAFIKGRGIVLSVMDTRFMMASMGSVVGEKLTRSIELATKEDKPLIVVSASGGARMQESALSLAQMAKTSAALARLDDAGGLFLSILTDPTTGGVTASFAMLGDLILAEPKALIGFAGPRVIANTVRQELPEGFQRAEFLQEKGFLDRVVHRNDMRNEIARLIDYAGK